MIHSKVCMEHEDEFYDLIRAFNDGHDPNEECSPEQFKKELDEYIKKHGSKEFKREWRTICRMKVPPGVHI